MCIHILVMGVTGNVEEVKPMRTSVSSLFWPVYGQATAQEDAGCVQGHADSIKAFSWRTEKYAQGI